MAHQAGVAVTGAGSHGGSIVEASAPVSQNLQGLSVGGNLNVAARDVVQHHHTHHHYGVDTIDLPPALRLVSNFRKIHIATLGRATPGTGLWIFVWETFRIWLDPDGYLKIMWGSGMPGAGKTVLAAIIINVLEAHAKASTKPICVAYVYIRYSDQTKATVKDLLEVLVKQTVERHADCLALAQGLYARHTREETQPSEEELMSLLQQFTQKVSVTFYVLDALDEAPTAIQLDIIEKLTALNIKLFITSRPLKAVEVHFPDAHCFPIVAQDKDIELHIAKEISRSADLRAILGPANAALRDEIISTIKQKCGGMFLHASLQLDALRDCTSVFEVREILAEFPTPIEDVYTQTWDRILDQPKRKALLTQIVLQWVLTATRSMTIRELQHAVATCPNTYHFDPNRLVPGDTLIGLCRGLVNVEKEGGLVRLVHYTAKETLERLIRQISPHLHFLPAAICMSCLVDCGFQDKVLQHEEELTSALQVDPLLEYAYESWSTHAQQCLAVASAAARVTVFVTGCLAFPLMVCGRLDILNALHLAAFFNFPISMAGTRGLRDPNSLTLRAKRPPLWLACYANSPVVVEELLCLPTVLVNLRSGDPHLPTALIVASMRGFDRIVGLLLNHPEVQVNLPGETRLTALMVAALYGRFGVLKLLLSHTHIQTELENHVGQTPLILAARYGRDDLLELLLAHPQIKVNHADACGRTALMAASEYGRIRNVKLLLDDPGVHVNVVDSDGDSALMIACTHGHDDIVQLLIAHPQVQVNLFNEYNKTALMLAVQCNSIGTVGTLLTHAQTQVNQTDRFGRTALAMAAASQFEYDAEPLVKLLLSHPLLEVGSDALAAAKTYKHRRVAQLLKDFSKRARPLK